VKVLLDDIEPGFQIDLAHKDLSLALGSASVAKVPLAMGAVARECLQLARSRGYGGKDFSALLDADADLAEDFPVAQFDSRPGRGPTSIVAVIPATS
jgi:4-hydroxybutyrate dehydrogenase / sulfolactaldehyde 3-reductase